MRLIRGDEVCEVNHEGLVVRDGPATRRFLTIAHARRAYAKAIADRLATGFVEMPDAHADLEARAVFADELLERGDAQGELIAIQLALRQAADPAHRAQLERRLRAHLITCHDELYGALAPLVRKPGRGGRTGARPAALEVTWVDGFADQIVLRHVAGSALHQTYAAMRALPIARHVTRLVLGEPGDHSYVQLINTMIAVGVPPLLRSLQLGVDARDPIHGGDLRPLIAATPGLVELDVHVASGVLGPFTSSTLRRLVIHAIDPTPVLASTAPALVDLELRAVAGCATFAEKLARSPLLARLQRLTCWRCNLEDIELSMFELHGRRFRHLESLDLRHNRFSARAIADAREELPNLVTDPPG
ncbi:MAG: hypothetical protein NT062_20890 [Proteobacteria bacterium]|nr:hypothetical protein [Pseudomonadota bacterium]